MSILPDGGDATEQQAAQLHPFMLRQSVEHLILDGVDFGMTGRDQAAFMVEELAERKFVGQMPLLHG